MAIRILIADDAKIVRDAIRKFLHEQAEIEIAGEAADFAQTIKLIEELKPDIVILDLYMPMGSDLTSAAARERIRASSAKKLAISVYDDQVSQNLAKGFGAPFFIDKMKLRIELLPAIKSLASSSA